jgi:hypothetical protein
MTVTPVPVNGTLADPGPARPLPARADAEIAAGSGKGATHASADISALAVSRS